MATFTVGADVSCSVTFEIEADSLEEAEARAEGEIEYASALVTKVYEVRACDVWGEA